MTVRAEEAICRNVGATRLVLGEAKDASPLRWMLPSLTLAVMSFGCSQAPGDPPSTILPALDSPSTSTALAPTQESLSTASVPVSSAEASPTVQPRRAFGPGEVEIPILLYHRLLMEGAATRYRMTVDAFRAQVEVLAEDGYQTVTIAEVASAIQTGAELPPRPVVLTFDDGNRDTYTEAFPILSEYGFHGVVFAVGNRTGAPGFLSRDELLALIEAGWEVGSHGWSHADLTTVGDSQWRQEILGSKLELERVLGMPVRSFAYPFGSTTSSIIARVAEYGYSAGVGLGLTNHHDRASVYYLSRREIYGYWTLEQFRTVLDDQRG